VAKATVEVLVDDLDGSAGAETVRIGWNGDWRELDLSKKNLSALSRVLDRYWNAARPIAAGTGRRRNETAASHSRTRNKAAVRDPKLIRAWAVDQGIAVPARGRIPTEVEQQYQLAHAPG
jgi:Lsr2